MTVILSILSEDDPLELLGWKDHKFQDRIDPSVCSYLVKGKGFTSDARPICSCAA